MSAAVTTFAPSGRVGPLDGVEIHVALAFYAEGTAIGRWDVSNWDDAAALWAGDAPLTDVTCDVLEVEIQRGRDRPLERFRPGTATVTVNDPDGIYSPWRTIASGATTYATIRPGIALWIWAVVDGETVHRFRGIVDAIADRFPNPGANDHAVTLTAYDYLAVLAAYDGLEQSPAGANELAGARLTRITDNAGYVYPRAFDPGTVALQATTLAKGALDEAGMVSDTEQGALFCDMDGTLVFRDRNGLIADDHYVDVQATFGEEEPEICYAAITPVVDLDETRNVVTIAPDGGTAVTVTDATSIALYGPRTYRRLDLIHADPADTTPIADRYLATFAFAANRITDFGVLLSTVPDAVGVVLALGLLWRVQVRRRAEGFQIVADLQIEAIGERITPDDWTLTFRTFDAEQFHGAGRWDLALWDTGTWGL